MSNVFYGNPAKKAEYRFSEGSHRTPTSTKITPFTFKASSPPPHLHPSTPRTRRPLQPAPPGRFGCCEFLRILRNPGNLHAVKCVPACPGYSPCTASPSQPKPARRRSRTPLRLRAVRKNPSGRVPASYLRSARNDKSSNSRSVTAEPIPERAVAALRQQKVVDRNPQRAEAQREKRQLRVKTPQERGGGERKCPKSVCVPELPELLRCRQTLCDLAACCEPVAVCASG